MSLPSALTGSGSAGVTAVAEAEAEAAVDVVVTTGSEFKVDAGLSGCLSCSSLATVHTRESAEMERGFGFETWGGREGGEQGDYVPSHGGRRT